MGGIGEMQLVQDLGDSQRSEPKRAAGCVRLQGEGKINSGCAVFLAWRRCETKAETRGGSSNESTAPCSRGQRYGGEVESVREQDDAW